jgi:acetone carboxylase alpha subunit
MAEIKQSIGEGGKTLKQMLEETARITEETGCYGGIIELKSKEGDPIKYELLHSRILSSLIAGRETTRMIAASPIVREVQELCIALYTPEGHAIATSTGIQVHIVPMGEVIQWMIRNDYEEDPGIQEGDLFCCNDNTIAGMHPADVYDITPIFYNEELVGWTATVIMEIDIGSVSCGPLPSTSNVERFTDGFFACAEKTGTNDMLRRDFLTRAERTLRYPAMFILDRKGALAANIKVREEVKRLIDEFGLDYYKEATRELIEDSRRIQLHRMRQRTVPGRLRNPQYLEIYLKDKPVPAYARNDVIRLIPVDIEIKPSGEITIDFEGAGDWGWHSLNTTPTGMYGGLSITLAMTIAYDGKANYGTLMSCEMKCPHDSIMNPSTMYLPTANLWAPVLIFGANFLDSLSRAYYARGFREEILLGVGQVSTVLNGLRQRGDPRIHEMGEFTPGGDPRQIGGLGSGARGIADGIDLTMFNPETDSGNMEVFELGLSALYIGGRIMPDSGGFGKYRGGFNLCSTQIIYGVEWTIAETMATHGSNRILQNRGIFGGYPGNVFYAYVVRNANTKELIEQRLPLPKVEGDPRNPDIKRLVEGDTTLAKLWWCSDEILKDYDIIQNCMHSNNGGYGDPIDRDTSLIQSDLDLGFTTLEACRNIYCAEAIYDAKKEEWTIDEQKTKELRETRIRERLERGVPFKKWWQETREKIMKQELDPLLLEMYHNSMEKGPRFAQEFREFWSLPQDFTFGGQ